MVVSKFPKCSEYALTSYYNREKKLIIEDYAEAVEQALTLAESKGAKAERERIYELMNSLRRGRFVFNDEMKQALDMLKDEITKVKKDG
jgi:hypothetical protein